MGLNLKVIRSRLRSWGMFLKGPKKLQQNLKPNMTTELFYAHILSMNRGSLHIRSFRHIHLSVFRY